MSKQKFEDLYQRLLFQKWRIGGRRPLVVMGYQANRDVRITLDVLTPSDYDIWLKFHTIDRRIALSQATIAETEGLTPADKPTYGKIRINRNCHFEWVGQP